VKEKLARPVRTAAQGGAAWTLVEFIDAFLFDMDERQYGALVAILTIGLSFVQTAIEDSVGSAILRTVEPKEVPVMDERGATELGNTLILALAVVGIVLIVLLVAGVL
jgi:hypothetical protein